METGIVSTIGQKCRRCYSCVRECPAIAIRVENGQAVVITERCISCGHCVKVCSQNAKKILSDNERLLQDILPNNKTIAIIAPSFSASFPDDYMKLPTALRKLGFESVVETAFGADLVSEKYRDYYEKNEGKTIISSPCPAIYNYIEKYFVELVPNLATIVSPMIAMGRYLKTTIGEDVKVVFIGPCVAKKFEYQDNDVSDAIDAVLTFKELKEIFDEQNINLSELEDSDFDPPHSRLGKSFSLSGGLLKTATIDNDVLAKDIIVVDGKEKVEEIIKDVANNKINSKFIDILFCEGCINGPAIDSDLNYYSKREKVIEYIDRNIKHVDRNVWQSNIYNARKLNLERDFTPNNQSRPVPSEEKIKEILARTNKFTKQDELNCGACGYPSCREYAIAIGKDLAEEDMCLTYLLDKIEKAYDELKETQTQLHNAEKLASIGQLAAGVAHEINNPLGTIMLYASMLKKEVETKVGSAQSVDDVRLIIDEANRCKNIVSNLLNFARQGKLKIQPVNLGSLIKDIVKSTNNRPEFRNIKIETNDFSNLENIEADADQIKQVFLNVINNGCEALDESDNKELIIKLTNTEKFLITEITDTGCGIEEENIKKLFTPFFTTKKIGKGTGLGLAITYGIVKMHKGDIKIESEPGKGTKVTIKIPIKNTTHNHTMMS